MVSLLAYRTTGLALKILTSLTNARVELHNESDLPTGGTIFVVNHFTRLETLLLPYYISQVLEKPVWSLASSEFFGGLMGRYLDKVGAVSVADPERDNLIIKTLVSESAAWIIFPEGRMVKNRKVFDKGSFMIAADVGSHAPHTGAAALALRAEILRQRWLTLSEDDPFEIAHLMENFGLSSNDKLTSSIRIVPVNVTYYPLRSADKLMRFFADALNDKLSPRIIEELLVEGSMLLDGVDIDIRFAPPLEVEPFVKAVFGRHTPAFVNNLKTRSALKEMTHRLMASIYGQTTVNLDQIVASLLYRTRGLIFSESALRARAYLAVTSATIKPIYFRHRSLKGSQIDLLLEKEGGRISELIELAREKKLLHQPAEGGLVFADCDGDCHGQAFHRIRVDNPFRVMANSIEPLRPLQKILFRLSWLPVFYLKKLLARRIFRIMEQLYLDDRLQYQGDPGLCPQEYGRPYLVNRFRPQAAVVLVHDWLEVPANLQGLADFLGRQGWLVLVPRLAGHATVAADLNKRDFNQWQVSVDEAYAYVAARCEKVAVCGVGVGSALAVSLAVRGFKIEALAVLFPVLEKNFKPLPGDLKRKYVYHDPPEASQRQVKKMLAGVAGKLPKLTVPFLLLSDDSLDESARQLLLKYYARISSREKEMLILPAANPESLPKKNNHGGRALVDFIRRNLF